MKIKNALASRNKMDYVHAITPATLAVTRIRVTYLITLTGSLLWCGALLAAPVLAASGNSAASVIYEFFRPLCHQIDQRSLHLMHAPLAVCSRCTAIYFAFLAGVLLYPLARSLDRPSVPGRRWLVLAALPMAIDVAAAMTGVHDSTPITRLITGGLLGFALAWFCLPALLDAVERGIRHSALVSSSRKDK